MTWKWYTVGVLCPDYRWQMTGTEEGYWSGREKTKTKKTQPSPLSFQNKYVLMLGNGRIKAKGILHFNQMPLPMLHRALALSARLRNADSQAPAQK